MIYVKENKNIITANLFVHDDFKDYEDRQKYYDSKVFLSNKLLTRNILTKSGFEEHIEEDIFDEYESNNEINDSLILSSYIKTEFMKKNLSNDELFNEIETILNSNLPLQMKQEYLEKCYYGFKNFAINILSNLKLETLRTYNIEELKKIVELCDKAQVFTNAKMIVSEENLEIAQENSKVLKLSKQFLDLK